MAQVLKNKLIVLAAQLSGNKMNENPKKNNYLNKLQIFLKSNLRNILILVSTLFVIFIAFQIFSFYSEQKLKKTSIDFFQSIENNDEIIENLNNIKKEGNIFSKLSILKLIQNNNKNGNYAVSNELYKEIIFSKDLSKLYKSALSAHASYTLINASYLEKSNIYIEDINIYISNISEDFESFISIKKELEYLLLITEIDLSSSTYNNNSKVLEKYNEISNSNSISSSVKERVNKIHEFQLYK